MAAHLGALPLIYVMMIFLAAPPAACLSTGLRKTMRARERRRPAGKYAGITVFAALTLAFNLAVMEPTVRAAVRGHGFPLTRLHLAALVLAWACFWVWVVLNLYSKKRRLAY